MEKEEKNIIEQPVEDTTVVNEDIIKKDDESEEVTPTEDETLTHTDDVIPAPVDDNTVVEPEDATLAPTDDVIPAPVEAPTEVPGSEVTEPVAEPVAEPVVDPIDVPAEEPVLDAPLADIVPPVQDIPVDAPVDVPAETPIVDPIIPEDPAAIAPTEEPGCEGTCACGNPDCDGSCGCCSSAVTVANYFGTLQECVTIAWRFHLKTRKHHIHVALNEFYEKALDIVDDIIEQYQGICGVVEDTFTNCVVGDGKTEGEYLTELKAFVENNRCVLGCHSEIDSTIDELLALIDSTNYKLTAFTESAVKSFEEFVYEDYPAIKESCKYDRFGERSCDDQDDKDYDPELENGECGGEEEE